MEEILIHQNDEDTLDEETDKKSHEQKDRNVFFHVEVGVTSQDSCRLS